MTKLKEAIAILECQGELPLIYRPHILSGRHHHYKRLLPYIGAAFYVG